jgi:CRP-like cAMP-binding protein
MRLAARPRDASEESQMQRLLSLRQVSLFSHMSLERLHAVERILRDAEYVSGEVIMRESEPGDDLFLLVEGHVDVLRGAGTPGEVQLNRLGPGAYFGEMAVLDGSPRSATVVAAGPVRALVLEGERLRELVHEMPELAFDLLRVLASRLRGLEERLVERGA